MRILLDRKRKEQLLNDLCVKLGFCLSSDAHDRILQKKWHELTELVDAIVYEEGLNPEVADIRVKRQVRDLILKANETV